MTTTVRINKFEAPNYSLGRYNRREYRIVDANLHYGDVRPFACPELLCESVGTYSYMYPLDDCKCLGFTDVDYIVQGFCHDQHFVLSNGSLYQSTNDTLCGGNVDCLAGVPNPKDAPAVVGDCGGGCDSNAVSYVITYVSLHAGIEVESAPSPPSNVIPVTQNPPNFDISWGDLPLGYCITAIRIYRTETTFQDAQTVNGMLEGSEYLLIADIRDTSVRSFRDNVRSHETGGPLLTYSPMIFAPPQGNLVGLARTDDGIVVAEKHRIYISESGQPMFTFDGMVEIEDEIRAIRSIGNSVFIFTNNRPYKIGYRHTDGTISIERNIIQRSIPLLSTKSLSIWGTKIYFSSTYALYEWDIGGYGSDIRSTTSQMLTPEQWKMMQPDTVRGVAYEYGYVLSCDGLEYSLMIEYGKDGTDTNVGYSIMPITYIKANVYSTNSDGVIIYEKDGDVYSWDWRRNPCGDFQLWDNIRPNLCEQCDCCPWTVEYYFDNEGKNRFTKMRVEFDEQSYTHINATFKQLAFGNQRTMLKEAKIINSRGFSIPKYQSAQTFSVELSSCAIMHEIRLGTSNQELTTSSNAVVE